MVSNKSRTEARSSRCKAYTAPHNALVVHLLLAQVVPKAAIRLVRADEKRSISDVRQP